MENKRVNSKQVAPLIRRRAATPSPRGGRLNLSQEPEINLSRLVVRHSARQAIEGERERFAGVYFSSRGACCCAGESVAAGVVCCASCCASCCAVAAAFAACRAASFAARRCFASSIIFCCSSGETQPPWHLPHSAQLLQPAPQEDLPCFLSLISFTAIAASAANKITEIMIVAGLFRIHCHIKRTSLVYCKYFFCILNGLKKCIFCRHGGGISFKQTAIGSHSLAALLAGMRITTPLTALFRKEPPPKGKPRKDGEFKQTSLGSLSFAALPKGESKC